MEAEYDQMADEYDATREVPTTEEVEAIRDAISDGNSLLDIGIGTGRFAKPLTEAGVDVTGVDVSRRMLLKAREKGLDKVVLGDAYSLPLRDKTFDSAVIIHVLHVVADWRRVMREAARVTRGNVVSILRVQEPSPFQVPGQSASPAPGASPGSYPVRTQHRMWQNEQELLAAAPPRRLERIRDEVVEVSVAEAFRRLDAKRPFGGQIVPPEFKEQMMSRIMEMAGSQVVHRRIAEDLAVWSADQLSAL